MNYLSNGARRALADEARKIAERKARGLAVEKKPTHEDVVAAVAEFQRRGGVIRICAPGIASGALMFGHTAHPSGHAVDAAALESTHASGVGSNGSGFGGRKSKLRGEWASS